MNIQVGDRVTYQVKDSVKDTCVIGDTIELDSIKENIAKCDFEILKIERPKYEVIKENKQTLNHFINKKEEVLEFNEIKEIVKLLLEMNNKIERINK